MSQIAQAPGRTPPMTEREQALVENLKAALTQLQRCLVLSYASAASFFLLVLYRADPGSVPFLFISPSQGLAEVIALVLSWVAAVMALVTTNQARGIASELGSGSKLTMAVCLYPGIAGCNSGFFRVTGVLLPALLLAVPAVIVTIRERGEWLGTGALLFLTLVPFLVLATMLWKRIGSD